MRTALLVVGHGTRDAAGVAEFERLVARVGRRLPGVDVAGGMIELAPPPVAAAVADLVGRGHSDVVAVPLVLVAAGHAKGDIPAALARERDRHPGLRFRYGRPLGPHPDLQVLLERRVDAALAGADRAGTAVLLVGRGSTDPDANAEVAKVARLFWEGRGYQSADYCFVSLAPPGVPEALERLRRVGAGRVVVAPYFLFPGVLADRIAAQARGFAAGQRRMDVRVAGVFGDSDTLAGLVLARYREALGGDLRMNCDTCQYRVALPGFAHRVGAAQRPHDHPHDPVADPAHRHGHGHPHGPP